MLYTVFSGFDQLLMIPAAAGVCMHTVSPFNDNDNDIGT